METAGVDPDISFDLSLALSEACANAVEHGGRTLAPRGSDAQDAGAYQVTAYLYGDRCRIEVSDSGPGFPAATVARRRPSLAESGRGLHLIAELSDHVRFRNRPGRGAVVSFDKMLKWRDDSLPKAS